MLYRCLTNTALLFLIIEWCTKLCLWLDCTAYAAGSECNSNEDADNAVASDCGSSTARTETGRDKLQCMSDVDVDSTGDITVVCPSGEVLDTAVPKSATDASISNRCSSMFKSSSMPLMCSQPPAVTLTNRTSLDSELRYLSTFAKLRQFTSSPLENSKNGQIARSPYMSPLLASDEMLRQLCPVHLIVCSASFYYWSYFIHERCQVWL